MPTNNSASEMSLNNSDPSEQVKFLIGHFRETMKQLFVVMDVNIDIEKPSLLTENLSDLSRDEIVKYCLINLNNQFLNYMKQTGTSPTYDGILNIIYKLFIESANKLISDIKEQHPSEYYTKLKTCLPLLTDDLHQSRYEQWCPHIPPTLCAIARHTIYKIELALPILKKLISIRHLLSPNGKRGKRRNALRILLYKKLKEQGMSEGEILNEIICTENHGKSIAKDDLLKKQNTLRKWKHDNKEKLEKELEPVEIEDVTVKLVPKAAAVAAAAVDSQKETIITFINLLRVILGKMGESGKISDRVVECFSQEYEFINKHLNDGLYLLFSCGIIGYIATELCYVRLEPISEMYEEYLQKKKELEYVNALIPNLAEKHKLYSSAAQNGKKTNIKLIEDMVAAEYASKNIENANEIIPSDVKTARENTFKRRFYEVRHFAEENETPEEKKASDLEARCLDDIFEDVLSNRVKKFTQEDVPLWYLKIISTEENKQWTAKYSGDEYLKVILAVCKQGNGWKTNAGIFPERVSGQLQRKFQSLCERGLFHKLKQAVDELKEKKRKKAVDKLKEKKLREYNKMVKAFKKVKWMLVPCPIVGLSGCENGKMYVPDVYWREKKSASRQTRPDIKHRENKSGYKSASKPCSKTDCDKKNNKRPRHMKRKRKKP